MEGLLAFGSLWFWLLFAVMNVMLLCWIEWEYSAAATISIGVFLGLLQWGGNDIFGYLSHNPSFIAYGIGAYFLAGTIWSVVKWWFFVRNQLEMYEEFKANWMAKNGLTGTTIPDDKKADFKEALDNRYRYGEDGRFELKPQVTDHKARIYLWMVYFPWSLVWTIINDPIKKVFRAIYRQIKAFLQRIADHVWAGTEQDYTVPEKKD